MRLCLIIAMAVLAMLSLAGCPLPGDDAASLQPAGLQIDEPAVSVSANDDEAEYRRRVAAWLMADDDKDGLLNKIEMDFGLDPDNPTDGPDIDGDGVLNFRDEDVDGDGILNQTDPDIDGDGLFNLLDADIDGDGVANASDFDIDADGVRNKWDWDGNSNGKDDAKGEDEEDKLGELGDEDLRFSAAVQALKEKTAAAGELTDPVLRQKALAQYQGDLRDLLKQVSKVGHEGQPIPVDGKEVELVAKSLANRFKWGGSAELEFDLKTAISQLTPLQGQPKPEDPTAFVPPDPTDAIDAVFRQATDIKEPGRAEAAKELQHRLDALTGLKAHLRQNEISAMSCSDAVSKLVAMPGGESPQEKVNGVTRLWDDMRAPKLGPLIDDLGDITKSLEQRIDFWSWDMMVDTLTRLDVLRGEGSLREKYAGLGEKFDGLMRLWDKVNEPRLDTLLTGLEKLEQELGQHIEGSGAWGWDEMISALESAPGIENGINAEQIDHVVEELGNVDE